MPFTYPPFSGLLFTPLTQVTPRLMEAGWAVATLGLLYLAIRMCFRALGYRSDRVTAQVALCLALIALSLEPVRTTLWLGQINILLLVLVLPITWPGVPDAAGRASARGWRPGSSSPRRSSGRTGSSPAGGGWPWSPG